MQNKVMDMRRTALRMLVAKHQTEFRELKEAFKKNYSGFPREAARSSARNDAEREIARKHYAEFSELHAQVKKLNGIPSGLDVYLGKARHLWLNGKTRTQIEEMAGQWGNQYARLSVRQKHKEEYREILKKFRGRTDRTIYTVATTVLVDTHRSEFRKYVQELIVAVRTEITKLEEEYAE